MLPWLLPAIGAGVGLISGLFGTSQKAKEEQAQLEQQQKAAWDQYLLGKAYSDEQYDIQQRQAYSDLAVQQRRLGEGMTQAVEEMNTGLLGQAYGIQGARIQTASSVGASLAAEGAGGTRGNAANSLMRAYEETSLERSVDLQNQQNTQAVNALMSQGSNAAEDISRERSSWQEGGYRYQEKAARDQYNLKTAQLGRDNFDWAIDQTRPNAMIMDYLGGAFGGIDWGLGLGSNIDNFSKDWFGDTVPGVIRNKWFNKGGGI